MESPCRCRLGLCTVGSEQFQAGNRRHKETDNEQSADDAATDAQNKETIMSKTYAARRKLRNHLCEHFDRMNGQSWCTRLLYYFDNMRIASQLDTYSTALVDCRALSIVEWITVDLALTHGEDAVPNEGRWWRQDEEGATQ